MDWIGYLLVGLSAGWMMEWFFDYFYWRKRFRLTEKAKVTAEEKLKSTENALLLIRQDLSEAEGEFWGALLFYCPVMRSKSILVACNKV